MVAEVLEDAEVEAAMIESASEETELLEVVNAEPDPEDQAASGGALPSNALLFTIYPRGGKCLREEVPAISHPVKLKLLKSVYSLNL